MDNIGGHTTQLSPDACKTGIDGVAWEEYMREQQPAYLSAQDDFFFNQSGDDKMVYVWDEDSNVGSFDETDEQEDITDTDTRIGNQATKRQVKWTKQIPISFEAFKTDQVGKRQKIGVQVGDRARLTQDKRTILDTYGDAFAGSINTTPDGEAWASASHTTLKGYTVDNLETGAMTADNMWTQVQTLTDQLGQDGELGGQLFEGLVVPFILYKTAKETMNSELVPFSAENQINIFDTDYGSVRIAASAFLNSSQNTNSNANTSYHLVSRNHMTQRKVLAGLSTSMIEPKYTKNDNYVLRARYMESHFIESWPGYVGTNGTT